MSEVKNKIKNKIIKETINIHKKKKKIKNAEWSK